MFNYDNDIATAHDGNDGSRQTPDSEGDMLLSDHGVDAIMDMKEDDRENNTPEALDHAADGNDAYEEDGFLLRPVEGDGHAPHFNLGLSHTGSPPRARIGIGRLPRQVLQSLRERREHVAIPEFEHHEHGSEQHDHSSEILLPGEDGYRYANPEFEIDSDPPRLADEHDHFVPREPGHLKRKRYRHFTAHSDLSDEHHGRTRPRIGSTDRVATRTHDRGQQTPQLQDRDETSRAQTPDFEEEDQENDREHSPTFRGNDRVSSSSGPPRRSRGSNVEIYGRPETETLTHLAAMSSDASQLPQQLPQQLPRSDATYHSPIHNDERGGASETPMMRRHPSTIESQPNQITPEYEFEERQGSEAAADGSEDGGHIRSDFDLDDNAARGTRPTHPEYGPIHPHRAAVADESDEPVWDMLGMEPDEYERYLEMLFEDPDNSPVLSNAPIDPDSIRDRVHRARSDVCLQDLSSFDWLDIISRHKLSNDAEREVRAFHGIITDPSAAAITPSEKRTALDQLLKLTGLRARIHGRCARNCYAFRDDDEVTLKCPVCQLDRYKISPRTGERVDAANYWTIPIIPRLITWFMDASKAETLSTSPTEAAKAYEHGIHADFWSGRLYHEILRKDKGFFQQVTDLAFYFSADEYRAMSERQSFG
ncbi:hypothetical protein BJ508DRAFT_336942, partial [Ascobolus immersus RN42]